MLQMWNNEFKELKIIKAHNNIIRQIIVSKDGIYTCSNDQYVKKFDFELVEKQSVEAHGSFIFALSLLENGFLSGGEDFSLNLYKNFKKEESIGVPTTIWDIK